MNKASTPPPRRLRCCCAVPPGTSYAASAAARPTVTSIVGYSDLVGRDKAAATDVESLAESLTTRRPPRVRAPGQIAAYDNYGYALAGQLVAEGPVRGVEPRRPRRGQHRRRHGSLARGGFHGLARGGRLGRRRHDGDGAAGFPLLSAVTGLGTAPVAASLGLAAGAVTARQRGWWNRAARSLFTLTALACLTTAGMLLLYHLVTPRLSWLADRSTGCDLSVRCRR
ncbi:hypothetical protein [Streptomyces sp. SJL17-4]|uniref:hypothetical protein n=1 Tax=Streptomyces sp. SJL17-4 TaxID=2967224 RepID=UPI0030D58F20